MAIAGSGLPPAIKLAPGEDAVYWDGSDHAWEALKRLGQTPTAAETGAIRRDSRSLDVEVAGGRRRTVSVGGWVIRRQDSSFEVYTA